MMSSSTTAIPTLQSLVLILILLCLLRPSSALLPASKRRRNNPFKSRYFTREQRLPPLLQTASPSNVTTTFQYAYCSPSDSIPVTYTNSPKTVSQWLDDNIGGEATAVLGFDVESIPDAPWRRDALFRGPATVQLATPDACLVIHLLRTSSGRPSIATVPILESVLADPSIIKAGVGIDLDLIELYQHWGNRLVARSRLDLGGIISKKNNNGQPQQATGLKRLSSAILKVELQKSLRLATSNWGQMPLTDAQLAYCGRDAWAGAAIVEELAKRDATKFSPNVLRDSLKEQPSIASLSQRAIERKNARLELKHVLAPFKQQQMMPREVMEQMYQLQFTIKNTAPNSRMVFDVTNLGIDVAMYV